MTNLVMFSCEAHCVVLSWTALHCWTCEYFDIHLHFILLTHIYFLIYFTIYYCAALHRFVTKPHLHFTPLSHTRDTCKQRFNFKKLFHGFRYLYLQIRYTVYFEVTSNLSNSLWDESEVVIFYEKSHVSFF